MNKLTEGASWNLISFAVQALAGATLNLFIIGVNGPDTLGVFNQFYALFVVMGQLFSFGIPDSTQKHLAEFYHDHKRIIIEKSALINSLISCIVAIIGMTIFSLIAPYFIKSDSLKNGLFWLIPAIAVFQFNKVLTNTFLGKKEFKTYAIGQALRAVLLVFFILIIVLFKFNNSILGCAFLMTEVCVCTYLIRGKIPIITHDTQKMRLRVWTRRHWHFGAKSICQNLLTETFVRIDVLVLSLFADDKSIGLYSFVAFFFEGIFQIPYLFRVITNPTLVPVVKKKNIRHLVHELKKVVITSALITNVAIIAAILLFPYIKNFLGLEHETLSNRLLITLLAGLSIHSFFSPFDNILLQGGKPGIQSVYMLILAGLNLSLNYILIPRLGLMGSALATAISFALSGPMVISFFYYSFNIKTWER